MGEVEVFYMEIDIFTNHKQSQVNLTVVPLSEKCKTNDINTDA